MNVLGKWRSYRLATDRLALLLAVGLVILLALGICLYIVVALVPNIRVRGELIGTVAVGEQMLADAQATSAAEPARVQAQVASAQTRVQEAAQAFLSETQATTALNQLYQYARDSGVTITELKTQPAPQVDEQSVVRLNTFALRATGALPRLLNFLARMRETSRSGFVIDNITIALDEAPTNATTTPQHVASMNVLLYTSAYAENAVTQPISGVVTALPTLAPLTPGDIQPSPALTLPVLVTVQPSPMTSDCTNRLSNGDFEQDGGWILGSANVLPQIVNNQPHGGARALVLGNPPELGINDQSGDSAIRQLVTIPATAPGATLRWWRRDGTSEAVVPDQATSGDRQELLLLNAEGQPLATLQQVRRNDNGWQVETIDLSAYRGQHLYLVFNVFNDGNGLPTWMYLDDVQLETCTGVAPLPTSSTAAPPLPTPTPIVIPAPTNTPIVIPAPTNTPIVLPAPTNTPLVVPLPTNTALPPMATATQPAVTVTPTTVSCANLLINGDFEVDSGWLLGQTALQPQYTTAQRHGGARAIGLGSTPERGGYTHNSYSSIRQLVTLPSAASVVMLRWWHLYGTAEAITTDPGIAGDRQEVLLLTADGRVLTTLQRVRRNDGVWQQAVVDLTAYRGQTVYLYFNVLINNNGAATWAYIDDVQLDTCAGVGPQPTATNTPIVLPTVTPIPSNTPIIVPTATNTTVALPTNTNTPTITPTPLVSPTATATTVASCVDLLVNGNFEADGSWQSDPVAVPPQITTDQRHNGARAMQLGKPPTANPDQQSYSSIRQLVTIPLNATNITLRWWRLAGTQEAAIVDPGHSADRQEVLLLTQSEQPFAVVQRTRRNDGVWQEEAVDLTSYRGQNIYIYFNVYNDGANGSTWMYVDDLQLNACS